MRTKLELGPYRIEASYSPKTPTWTGWPWTHLKLHRSRRGDAWTRHLVWGRVSILVDTPDLDFVSVCAECDCNETPSRVSSGDESWNVCQSCGSIEGRTREVTVREYERGEA